MNKHTTSVFGIYLNQEDVKVAIKSLKHFGFHNSNITILRPDKHGEIQEVEAKDFAYKQITQIKNGAVVGAIIGFFVLGIAGMVFTANFNNLFPDLVASGSVTNQNLVASSMISTGPMIGILTAFIGTIVGAAAGALVGIGTPQTAARRYGKYLKSGGILLAVQLDHSHQTNTIHEVLQKTGGQDITTLDEEHGLKVALHEEHSPQT